jgi:hypothetical protein
MGSFLLVGAAPAGLRILSGVDRKVRRMFALEVMVEVVFAVS